MRMRRKKNLEQKIEQCGEYLISCHSDDPNYITASQKKEYFDYEAMFGNDNPVEMEIGCGKGQFICELAKRNPDINYLAVELNANVIMLACRKAMEQGITNIRFIKCKAEYLGKYIPEQTIGRIYLNFSCPFPKKRYASHRLTDRRFLSIYRAILKTGGDIRQKTDNMQLFEYSIQEFSQCGFALRKVTLDLHNSEYAEGNIMTEYEKRFTDLGQPIYSLEAYINQ